MLRSHSVIADFNRFLFRISKLEQILNLTGDRDTVYSICSSTLICVGEGWRDFDKVKDEYWVGLG